MTGTVSRTARVSGATLILRKLQAKAPPIEQVSHTRQLQSGDNAIFEAV